MKLYIVGAGPGDPDLITVKGLKLLQAADVILFTDSLVNEELVALANPDAEVLHSSGLALEQMVELMADRVRQGKTVVRLQTGDPSVYGAIMEQIALLKAADVEAEIVPGVSSVFAAAAAVGAELTIPELTQTLILTRAEGRTPVPEREKLRALAEHHCTLALYLSATLTKKVVRELAGSAHPAHSQACDDPGRLGARPGHSREKRAVPLQAVRQNLHARVQKRCE